MKKLKCSSCGAELEIEENKEYAKCNYCETKYKLNEDLNINLKMDKNAKDIIEKGLKKTNDFIVLALVPLLAFAIILTIATTIKINSTSNIKDNIYDKYEKEKTKIEQENKKTTFNFQFIYDNGTKNTIFIQSTLDKIIQSNKINDRLITLIFEEIETTNESEIIEIKHSLNGDYEVSFDYDSDGYINKIIIEKIN